jgi:hypothetical protein
MPPIPPFPHVQHAQLKGAEEREEWEKLKKEMEPNPLLRIIFGWGFLPSVITVTAILAYVFGP